MIRIMKFNDIRFDDFMKLRDELKGNYKHPDNVNLCYSGNAETGELKIEEVPGHSKDFNTALKTFVDIYCR